MDFFSSLQILPYYETYGGYRCYFFNWNTQTAPQIQVVLSLQGVLASDAGHQRCFLITCFFIPLQVSRLGLHFLKDVGLIRSSMLCSKCGCQMFWCVYTNRKDVYRWRCRRITYASASIRQGLWFQQTNLNFTEVFILTYGIIHLYEHELEHLTAFEAIPHYFEPYGVTSITWPLYICSGVPNPQPWPVHQIYGHRCNRGLELHTTSPPTRSWPKVTIIHPISALLSSQNAQRASLWRVHHHGWRPSLFIELCALQTTKMRN